MPSSTCSCVRALAGVFVPFAVSSPAAAETEPRGEQTLRCERTLVKTVVAVVGRVDRDVESHCHDHKANLSVDAEGQAQAADGEDDRSNSLGPVARRARECPRPWGLVVGRHRHHHACTSGPLIGDHFISQVGLLRGRLLGAGLSNKTVRHTVINGVPDMVRKMQYWKM